MTEHHFVVVGTMDEEGKVSFSIDLATTEARFPDGGIWVPDETEAGGYWTDCDDEAVETDYIVTSALAKRLS